MIPAVVALLVVGHLRGFTVEKFNGLLRPMNAMASRIDVYLCTDEPESVLENAIVCDTSRATGMYHRLELCYICAGQAAILDDYTHIVRTRPDMNYLTQLQAWHMELHPNTVNCKLRAARGHVGLTDAMFNFMYATADCDTGVCQGSCDSCLVADDQFAVMSPAVAHTYFRVYSLLNSTRVKDFKASGKCVGVFPHPEHQLTATLYAFGVDIKIIDLDTRIDSRLHAFPTTTNESKRCGVMCDAAGGGCVNV